MASARQLGFLIGKPDAPILIETFIDLVCPFSKRSVPRLFDIQKRWPDHVQIRVHLWVQTWHFQSSLLAKGAIAVAQWDRGSAMKMVDQIYLDRDSEWVDSVIMDKTANQIIRKLGTYANKLGMPEAKFQEAVVSDEVTKELKFETKYGRQNGIHASPTYMINGIIAGQASSGWGVKEWAELLEPLMKQ